MNCIIDMGTYVKYVPDQEMKNVSVNVEPRIAINKNKSSTKDAIENWDISKTRWKYLFIWKKYYNNKVAHRSSEHTLALEHAIQHVTYTYSLQSQMYILHVRSIFSLSFGCFCVCAPSFFLVFSTLNMGKFTMILQTFWTCLKHYNLLFSSFSFI